MAELPKPDSMTVAAIYAAYEAARETGYREHLGASLIGAECKRAIWYSWRWASAARHPGRILRLFQTGHLEEPRFVADLRAIGCEVHDVDPETGKQFCCRDESGHFGGSCDAVALGVPEAPTTWHLVEMKTHSTKSFAALVKDGVAVAKPQHFAQMQVYMHLMALTRGLYLARNKDTDELYSERIRYDAEAALRLIAKAHQIIASPEPLTKISEDSAWYQCRFCDHHAVCHGYSMPAGHCRSCAWATPDDGGTWLCERTNTHRTYDEQQQGCVSHIYIPALVPGEQVDAAPDGSWVEYRMKDGSTWRDGIPF